MILHAIAKKLKRQSQDDFKGCNFESWLIVQAVTWHQRYPLSYGDLESMFLERGFEVDHSTVNRWGLAYAAPIEKKVPGNFGGAIAGRSASSRLTSKFGGNGAIFASLLGVAKHGAPMNFLLTAKRDLDAAKQLVRKMLKDPPLLTPIRSARTEQVSIRRRFRLRRRRG